MPVFKYKSVIAIICLLSGFSVIAQNYKPKKITKEELLEKAHPLDSSAPAAIIHRIGKSYFPVASSDWYLITEVQTRIKVYKKEGYKYATDQITYYTGGQMTKGYFSDAYTYNLEGDEIVRTKLKSDGEFTEEVSKDYVKKKITMPNVKEGSIIEYTYTVMTPHFWTFRDWYFQYDIPANYVEYKITVPQYFLYNRYLSGYEKVNKEETSFLAPVGANYNELTDVFWAKDVKAFKDEPFVYNPENYMSILKYELASTNFPGGIKKYSSDWESLAKTIYKHDDFGKELNQDSYFKEDMQNILEGTPENEKMNKIFSYVKSRMNWDGENGYLCERGVKKAFESKTGNVAEINLMLTAMLREAGFNANPVLVSTRNNGVALYPSHSSYNYVIAGVEIDKKIVLLDATSKFTQPDILPERTLNWRGRMIRKDGTTTDVDLMQMKNAKETITVVATLDKEGTFKGKVRDQRNDYYAYTFKERYAGMNEEKYLEKLENKYKGLEIETYKRTLDKENPGPVTEEYDFTNKGMVEIIDSRIYFNPMLFFADTQNPFRQEERKFPVDFGFPWQDKYMVTIKLPEGYVVESLPKPAAVTMEQNIGSFKYNVVSQNNTIQVLVTFDLNYHNVSSDYYRTLKDFYQMMADKQKEKIVLKKA
ncbi:DUF3857 domain-containing protein [Flavobacterium hauense]